MLSKFLNSSPSNSQLPSLLQVGTGGQQSGAEGTKSSWRSHSRQAGLTTSRPKEDGHLISWQSTLPVDGEHEQNWNWEWTYIKF